MRTPDTLNDLRWLVGQLMALRDAKEGRPHAHNELAPPAYAQGYEAAWIEQHAKEQVRN